MQKGAEECLKFTGRCRGGDIFRLGGQTRGFFSFQALIDPPSSSLATGGCDVTEPGRPALLPVNEPPGASVHRETDSSVSSTVVLHWEARVLQM
ncbi:hypothetical protein EYF80_018938 [Liparis tanakae]|uniref:Uncharacterized protein n=1 Tax=Liparis tanakae TaxID=230148 RepID=A0A4Z2I0K1_9TELE|nr:hypothetical protein EYF80_018938 [Liparis tanakae]